MTFLIDNNLGPRLAHGMAEFGEDVKHLGDILPGDSPDVQILQFVGERGWILITRDKRVRFNPAEKQAILQFRVGTVFLGGKGLTACRIIQQLVRSWPNVKRLSKSANRPFAFLVNAAGTSVKPLSL